MQKLRNCQTFFICFLPRYPRQMYNTRTEINSFKHFIWGIGFHLKITTKLRNSLLPFLAGYTQQHIFITPGNQAHLLGRNNACKKTPQRAIGSGWGERLRGRATFQEEGNPGTSSSQRAPICKLFSFITPLSQTEEKLLHEKSQFITFLYKNSTEKTFVFHSESIH